VSRTTTLSFAFAAIAITWPLLTISLTESVVVRLQVAPGPPVQLTGMVIVLPRIVAFPAVAFGGAAGGLLIVVGGLLVAVGGA
jgi:hypothetical protein